MIKILQNGLIVQENESTFIILKGCDIINNIRNIVSDEG